MPCRSELIGLLYEASLDTEAVSEFLKALRFDTASQNATFAFFDRVSGHLLYQTSNFPVESTLGYIQEIEKDDRMSGAKNFYQSVAILLEHDVCDTKAYRRTYVYEEYFKPYDMEWMMGMGCLDIGGCDLFVVLNRESKAADFCERDREHLQKLAPYMERALRFKVNRLNELALTKHIPQITVDAQSRLVATNPAGDALIQKGHIVSLKHGRLTLSKWCTRQQATLDRMVRTTTSLWELPQDHTPLTLTDDQRHYHISAHPTVHIDQLGIRHHHATLLVLDVQAAEALPRLHQLGLTDSEQDVLRLFLTGQSIREIARKRSRSIHTVRTQFKAIMRKCSVSTQAELVRFLHQESSITSRNSERTS